MRYLQIILGNNNNNQYWLQVLDEKQRLILEKISEELVDARVFEWFLEALHPVFFSLPADCLEIGGSSYSQDAMPLQGDFLQKVADIVARIKPCMENTNQFLLTHRQDKGMGKRKKAVMAYVLEEEERFRRFYCQYNKEEKTIFKHFFRI